MHPYRRGIGFSVRYGSAQLQVTPFIVSFAGFFWLNFGQTYLSWAASSGYFPN
jgi:hypothetical protein